LVTAKKFTINKAGFLSLRGSQVQILPHHYFNFVLGKFYYFQPLVKCDLNLVNRSIKAVLTEEDKLALRVIAVELLEIRKLIAELAEKLVNLSDKELMKSLNADQIDLKEDEVQKCRLKLQGQLDSAEREF
jgi:hypothetical protein